MQLGLGPGREPVEAAPLSQARQPPPAPAYRAPLSSSARAPPLRRGA